MDIGERPYVFPFTAFVDQEELKLALLLLAINPKIGGLLIRGEKGTGKSALVRALADLLPPIKVVADCPFNDDPDDVSNMCTICRERVKRGEKLPVTYKKMEVITLPLSASIDAVVGTLDIEKVLREGLKAFQPGILAKANGQILYINVFRRKSRFPVGGRTPLATGILKAVNILKLELRKNSDIIPIILIFSDGIASAPLRQIKIPDYMYDLCPIERFADSIYVAKLVTMARIPIITVNFYYEEDAKLNSRGR